MAEHQGCNYVDGKWVQGTSEERIEVSNPATGVRISSFAASTIADVDAAVEAAERAFTTWRSTPVTTRASRLFEFRQLLRSNVDGLAETIVRENGKTLSEAKGEMVRALEYVEHACAVAELQKGAISMNVGSNIDTLYIREPLGTFAIIAPFNFPAMIPLYFSWAVAVGNSVVVKPSELCPLTAIRIVELADLAGFPPGTVNMILGGPTAVERLCTHPDIAGVSFVGSSDVARRVYELASAHGKRAQCQGGAKNHLVVTDTARLDRCLQNVINSAFGNASQRCFAGSNILVQESVYESFLKMFLDGVRAIRVGDGMEEDVSMGPVISPVALERFYALIDDAERAGAKIYLDGRRHRPEKAGTSGNFIGPTVIEAQPGMKVFDEEVFGPIRCVMPIRSIDEAIEIVNSSVYGHTAAIYTEDGGVARSFADRAQTGQVGINVGTPAPIAFYPVGGRRASFYGSLRGRADDAIDFYTDKKVIVSTWHNTGGR